MKVIQLCSWFAVGAAAVTLAAAPRAAAAEADGWLPLFDGKTLNGWRASENQGGFKVSEGMIAFDGRRSHLFYVGPVRQADFKNFEFKADVLAKSMANSGVFFHTEFQETGFPTKGFEAQVANTYVGPGGYVEMKKTGSLYGIRNLNRSPVRDNEWFTLRVTVRGKRIQIWLNDLLAVDYVEPVNPVIDPNRPGRRLSHGTFALQGHDAGSKVFFKNLMVRPLPDDLPDYPDGPVRFDAVDEEIVRLSTANYPLVDFHTHLKGGLTMAQVLEHGFKTGLNHGVAVNGGLGFSITNDAGVDGFLKSVAGQPVFLGMQAEGREWPTLFSPAAVARFDYVFTDGMTIFDHRGKRARLWMKDEVDIPDKQAFMEHLVDTIVKILNEEPIDIYANPTFLPEILAKEYDALWTPERMERVIRAAANHGVAIEINNRYRIPSAQFLKRAKQAGLKFTLGTNNTDPNLGRDEYGLEMIKECGLTYKDFWMPKPDGQKPIQTRIAK